MRIEDWTDAHGLQKELDLLELLRALARSPTSYVVLREVALSGATGLARETLRGRDHNLGRAVDLLARESLAQERGRRLLATAKGKRLVDAIERAANAGSGRLAGRRVVTVAGTDETDLDVVEGLLADSGGEVLRSEGAFEFVAVLSDEFDLASDLIREVRRAKAKATMTRIVGHGARRQR